MSGNYKIILKNINGIYLHRKEVIKKRRGAFLWLPVGFFSNDLVHGSWWFVLGTLLNIIMGLYALTNESKINGFSNNAGEQKILGLGDYDIMWSLLGISSIFYFFGSIMFVRAFDEHSSQYKHLINWIGTDELVGAWMYWIGTFPFLIYSIYLYLIYQGIKYIGLILISLLALGITGIFVRTCYPTKIKRKNYIYPTIVYLFGVRIWIIKHCCNDWLVSTWIIWFINLFAGFYVGIDMFIIITPKYIIIPILTLLSTIAFIIGSTYFVSGSYPHAKQFYYNTLESNNGVDLNGNSYDEPIQETISPLYL